MFLLTAFLHFKKSMSTVLFVSLILITAKTSFAERHFLSSTNHYYEAFYTPQGVTRFQADSIAVSNGGYLVSVLSQEENQFVYSLVDASYWSNVSTHGDRLGPWLGGVSTQNGWTWSSGEAFIYSNWASNQPDTYGGFSQYNQFYAGINVGPTWGDHPGGVIPGYSLPRGLIVEYNDNSEPVEIAINIDHAVEIHWVTVAGLTYQVQRTLNLDNPVWENVEPTIIGDGSEKSFFDKSRDATNRFYRVITIN